MLPGEPGQQAAARRALQQALLQQVGLDHLLERVALLGQRRRERVDADRPAAVVARDAGEIAPVERVEAELVDLEAGQRAIGEPGVDRAAAADQREVAHAAQQAHRDPRRAPGAPRDLGGAAAGERQAEDPGAAHDDLLELPVVVEIEPREDAEAVAQAASSGGPCAWSRRSA